MKPNKDEKPQFDNPFPSYYKDSLEFYKERSLTLEKELAALKKVISKLQQK